MKISRKEGAFAQCSHKRCGAHGNAAKARPGFESSACPGRRAEFAFSVVETVVAMLLLGLVTAGLYGGISMSFRNVQLNREELRALQISEQTLEVLRLCTWEQGSPTTNFLPRSFTVPFENTGSTNLMYTVTVTITNAPGITEIYSNDLRMVTVQTTWMDNNMPRTRTMKTYVARPGLLWYVPY